MPLSLTQSQAITQLATFLYGLLPGTPHPMADQTISYQGIARSLGLAQYWRGGSKLPAITALLTGTLEERPSQFCTLIIETVRRGIPYRQNKGDAITREEIERLNKLVAKVGFKIPDLHDPAFLDSLPREDKSDPKPNRTIPLAQIDELQRRLIELSKEEPSQRGIDFEKFLGELFEVFELAPRNAFRLAGEQIDGSFQLQGDTYLVEAKWQYEGIGARELRAFASQVSSKASWSRGLFVSMSKFTNEGLEAFSRGTSTNIICMDAQDLFYILKGKIDLRDVLDRKKRRGGETGQAFVSVVELFPGQI